MGERPDRIAVHLGGIEWSALRKPALRPHTIAGWWQVWSGSMCIALLTPEDVEPLRLALLASASHSGKGPER